MKDFRKLNVWEKAHQFTLLLYLETQTLPSAEQFGLTSQLRRAAVSIPSNIAEGCGRNTDSELRRFCEIAMGSASEVEYQLLLCQDLGFLTPEKHTHLHSSLLDCKRMLNTFIQTLQQAERQLKNSKNPAPKKANR